ncbi:MAG: redoxin domain-containing protein [Paludibacteraceae bacterium]|nr:redoxin domain-containing protein [Paludibacteraceae bacterium]
MKNFTFFLTTLFLIALTSCTQKANVLVKGTIDDGISDLEGKELVINIKNNNETGQLKGTVKNHHFEICGHIDEPQWTVVRWEIAPPFLVILEAGTVSIDIKLTDGEPVIRVGGTESNNILQQFTDREKEFETALEAETELSEDELFDKYREFVKGEIIPQINTLGGKCLFSNYFYLFTLPDLDEIFGSMTDQTLQDERIKRIHTAYELQKTTAEGETYTDFSAKTPEGTTLTLSEIVGRKEFVLVDFWASWCGPCRASMPQMKQLYDKYGEYLDILGVSLDNDKDAWTGAIKSLDLPWKHISDLKGWDSEPAKKYGVRSIPCTVLINSEGTILGRNLSHEKIAEIIEQTLNPLEEES